MEDLKNINSAVSILRGIIRILLLILLIFYSVHYAKAEGKVGMNYTPQEALLKPSGTISIIIDNHSSIFSPKEYFFVLLPAQDMLTLSKNKSEMDEFKIKYEKDRYDKKGTKLAKLSNVKELDQLVHLQYPREWRAFDLTQDELIDFVFPNKEYSYIIFWKLYDAALIDVKAKTIKNLFRYSRQFTWDKTGNRFAFEITLFPHNYKNIAYLEFAIYDVIQNKEILRRKILKKTMEKVELISNFAWSPDSQFVAVLTAKVVDVSWTTIMGHGTATFGYNLSIFNLAGDLIYVKPIEGRYKGYVFTRMVWN